MSGLQQIAREAGCSVSTVSRVLNNYKNFSISPELEDRIRTATRKYDYKPNPYYRTLRSKKSNLISIMCRPTVDLADLEVAKWSFIETVREDDFSEIVQYMDMNRSEIRLPDLPFEGALVFDPGDKMPLSLMENLEENKTPYVVFNSLCGEHGVSILVDEKQLICMLLDHLWNLGHRKIAYMNAWEDGHYSVRERQNHYVDWMVAHGEEPVSGYDVIHIEALPFLEQSMAMGATAVVCYSASRAMYLLQQATRKGIAVPQKLSIAAVNDNWAMPLSSPPLTCSSIPWKELGKAAGRFMLLMLKGELVATGQQFRFPGQLIVRESTTCPLLY